MNNKAEIKQNFNDTTSNTINTEGNMIHENVFPFEEINIKEEYVEYESAEQKITSGLIKFDQNIDSKPEFLQTENCKITCNSNTQNFGDDCKSFVYHQIKSENNQIGINPSETEACNKETVNNEKLCYSSSPFKVNSNDIPSNTIYIECNTPQKNVLPLTEIDNKSEYLDIEDCKISCNLDPQNVNDDCQSFVHHRFKSEDSEMDYIPPETEICDKEVVNNEEIYYCSKCSLKFDSKLNYSLHLNTEHIVNTDKKLFKCNICRWESQNKSCMENHMKTEHIIDNKNKSNPVKRYTRTMEKTFKCNSCEYESKHQSNMVNHVKNKHKDLTMHDVRENIDRKKFVCTAQGLFKCKFCDYECRHRSSIYGHILSKHERTSVKKHKCSQCEYQTNDSTLMKRHRLIHDDIRPYVCEVCNKRFRCRQYLKNHSWTHSGEKRFQCSYCDYKNNHKFGIKNHMKNKHIKLENREYKCSQCPYETNHKTNLNKHSRLHLLGVEKVFKCVQCSYSTNFKSSLKLHLRNKHEDVREYKCKRCKYETNYKCNMKQHMLKHDSVTLYECNICNKLFKSNVCLKQHIKCIHLEGKKFHCAHCDFKTNYKFNLVLHVNSKHAATQHKKYKCAKCNYKSDNSQGYERHLKNHLMKIGKIFKCSQCSYRTNVSASLKRHCLHVHNKVKAFKCYVCNKQFQAKKYLNLHVKGMHVSEKKYNCEQCNYKTNFKRLFTGHILTNHSS